MIVMGCNFSFHECACARVCALQTIVQIVDVPPGQQHRPLPASVETSLFLLQGNKQKLICGRISPKPGNKWVNAHLCSLTTDSVL